MVLLRITRKHVELKFLRKAIINDCLIETFFVSLCVMYKIILSFSVFVGLVLLIHLVSDHSVKWSYINLLLLDLHGLLLSRGLLLGEELRCARAGGGYRTHFTCIIILVGGLGELVHAGCLDVEHLRSCFLSSLRRLVVGEHLWVNVR
jgi:hypothetical protein